MMILTRANRFVHKCIVRGGIYAEGVPGIDIYDCSVIGGRCNIHLVRCKGVRIFCVQLSDPEISASDGDEHGKHILLDHCHDARIEIVRCQCREPSGDGINLCGCRRGMVRAVNISGPKRRDDNDTAVGVVLDAGSRDCVVDVVSVTESDPPAVTVLGAGHKVNSVEGLVQVGRDGKRPGVRDITLRHCQAWVATQAQGITFGEGARRSQ